MRGMAKKQRYPHSKITYFDKNNEKSRDYVIKEMTKILNIP